MGMFVPHLDKLTGMYDRHALQINLREDKYSSSHNFSRLHVYMHSKERAISKHVKNRRKMTLFSVTSSGVANIARNVRYVSKLIIFRKFRFDSFMQKRLFMVSISCRTRQSKRNRKLQTKLLIFSVLLHIFDNGTSWNT